MYNLNTVINTAMTAVKPVWLALTADGAILPGTEGRFVIGNPSGQLTTVHAKAWPKAATSWEATSAGVIVHTANGKMSLAAIKSAQPGISASTQEYIAKRVSEATGEHSIAIEGKELASVLTALAPIAAGADEAVISNILLRFNPGASVAIATDGYKLVERCLDDAHVYITFDAMINAVDAKHLAAMLKADGYPLVRLACIDKRLTIIAGSVAYFGPDTMYGVYPRYEEIIPTSFESNRIVVNVKELLATIKAATIKDASMSIDAASGYGIKFTTRTDDSDASAHCNADVSEPWQVNVTPSILTAVLKGLDCESVVIYPNAASKLGPIVIRPLTGPCRAIVMPVNRC